MKSVKSHFHYNLRRVLSLCILHCEFWLHRQGDLNSRLSACVTPSLWHPINCGLEPRLELIKALPLAVGLGVGHQTFQPMDLVNQLVSLW